MRQSSESLRAVESAAVATIINAVLPPGRDIVWRLAARDGWNCHYCERALGWGHPSVRPPEVEHLTPRSRNGEDHPTNLVLSCGQCNRLKGTMTEAEFHQYWTDEYERNWDTLWSPAALDRRAAAGEFAT